MKKVVVSIFTVLVALFAFTGSSNVQAQSATNATWTSAIIYQNTSNSSGNLSVTFYDGSGTEYSVASLPVTAFKSGTIQVGTVATSPGLPAGFQGSAVVSSDVNVAVTYLQFDSSAAYGRMIYNGFTADQGSLNFSLPTILKQKFGTTSRVGVQNIGNTSTSVQLRFFSSGSATPTFTDNKTIPAKASYIFSLNDYANGDIPVGFTGSLEIVSDSQPVVAASQETSDSGRAAYAFEGVAVGEQKVFVPTMICKKWDATSYYAVQAVGGDATFDIDHFDTDGTRQGGQTNVTLTSGAKLSVNPCADGVAADLNGSSVITTSSGRIQVVVKVVSDAGFSTGFIARGTGATRQALPYVRWSSDAASGYRSYIAVMNVSDSTASTVTAKYYDDAGNLVGTHNLGPLLPAQKTNTSVAMAVGAVDWNGSVVIESDQPVLVTNRSQINVSLGDTSQIAEDYTGIEIP